MIELDGVGDPAVLRFYAQDVKEATPKRAERLEKSQVPLPGGVIASAKVKLMRLCERAPVLK